MAQDRQKEKEIQQTGGKPVATGENQPPESPDPTSNQRKLYGWYKQKGYTDKSFEGFQTALKDFSVLKSIHGQIQPRVNNVPEDFDRFKVMMLGEEAVERITRGATPNPAEEHVSMKEEPPEEVVKDQGEQPSPLDIIKDSGRPIYTPSPDEVKQRIRESVIRDMGAAGLSDEELNKELLGEIEQFVGPDPDPDRATKLIKASKIINEEASKSPRILSSGMMIHKAALSDNIKYRDQIDEYMELLDRSRAVYRDHVLSNFESGYMEKLKQGELEPVIQPPTAEGLEEKRIATQVDVLTGQVNRKEIELPEAFEDRGEVRQTHDRLGGLVNKYVHYVKQFDSKALEKNPGLLISPHDQSVLRHLEQIKKQGGTWPIAEQKTFTSLAQSAIAFQGMIHERNIKGIIREMGGRDEYDRFVNAYDRFKAFEREEELLKKEIGGTEDPEKLEELKVRKDALDVGMTMARNHLHSYQKDDNFRQLISELQTEQKEWAELSDLSGKFYHLFPEVAEAKEHQEQILKKWEGIDQRSTLGWLWEHFKLNTKVVARAGVDMAAGLAKAGLQARLALPGDEKRKAEEAATLDFITERVDHLNDRLFPVSKKYVHRPWIEESDDGYLYNNELLLPKVLESTVHTLGILYGASKVSKPLKAAMSKAGVPGSWAAYSGHAMALTGSHMALTVDSYYREALENGLDPESASYHGLTTGLITGLLENIAPQRYVFGQPFRRMSTTRVAKYMAEGVSKKDAVREGLNFTMQEMGGLALQETGVALGKMGTEYWTNQRSGESIFALEQGFAHFAETAVISALSAPILTTPTALRSRSVMEQNAWYLAGKDPARIKSRIQGIMGDASHPLVEQEVLTEENFERLSRDIDEYAGIVQSIPEHHGEGIRSAASELIRKRQILEQENERADEVIQERNGGKIEQINEQLRKLMDFSEGAPDEFVREDGKYETPFSTESIPLNELPTQPVRFRQKLDDGAIVEGTLQQTEKGDVVMERDDGVLKTWFAGEKGLTNTTQDLNIQIGEAVEGAQIRRIEDLTQVAPYTSNEARLPAEEVERLQTDFDVSIEVNADGEYEVKANHGTYDRRLASAENARNELARVQEQLLDPEKRPQVEEAKDTGEQEAETEPAPEVVALPTEKVSELEEEYNVDILQGGEGRFDVTPRKELSPEEAEAAKEAAERAIEQAREERTREVSGRKIPERKAEETPEVKLTEAEAKTNELLEMADEYGQYDRRYTRKRREVLENIRLLAGELGYTIKRRGDEVRIVNDEGKRVKKTQRGVRPTDEATDFIPLTRRAEPVQKFFSNIFDAMELNPEAWTIMTGWRQRYEDYGGLTKRDIPGALSDIQQGKNSNRANDLMDAMEAAWSQGEIEVIVDARFGESQRGFVAFEDIENNVKEVLEHGEINRESLPEEALTLIAENLADIKGKQEATEESSQNKAEGIDALIGQVGEALEDKVNAVSRAFGGTAKEVKNKQALRNFRNLLKLWQDGTIQVRESETKPGRIESIERVEGDGTRNLLYETPEARKAREQQEGREGREVDREAPEPTPDPQAELVKEIESDIENAGRRTVRGVNEKLRRVADVGKREQLQSSYQEAISQRRKLMAEKESAIDENIEEAKGEMLAAFKAMQEVGLASDPKKIAERQYAFHKALVKLAKGYIRKGVTRVQDLARRIGIKSADLRFAWEEAMGRRTYREEEFAAAPYDIQSLAPNIKRADKKRSPQARKRDLVSALNRMAGRLQKEESDVTPERFQQMVREEVDRIDAPIGKRQARALINRALKARTPLQMSRYVDYARRVIDDANYEQEMAEVSKQRRKVKKNIKAGAYSILSSHVSLLNSIDPRNVPAEHLPAYRGLMDRLAQPKTQVNLQGISEEISDVMERLGDYLADKTDVQEDSPSQQAKDDPVVLEALGGIVVRQVREQSDQVLKKADELGKEALEEATDFLNDLNESGVIEAMTAQELNVMLNNIGNMTEVGLPNKSGKEAIQNAKARRALKEARRQIDWFELASDKVEADQAEIGKADAGRIQPSFMRKAILWNRQFWSWPDMKKRLDKIEWEGFIKRSAFPELDRLFYTNGFINEQFYHPYRERKTRQTAFADKQNERNKQAYRKLGGMSKVVRDLEKRGVKLGIFGKMISRRKFSNVLVDMYRKQAEYEASPHKTEGIEQVLPHIMAAIENKGRLSAQERRLYEEVFRSIGRLTSDNYSAEAIWGLMSEAERAYADEVAAIYENELSDKMFVRTLTQYDEVLPMHEGYSPHENVNAERTEKTPEEIFNEMNEGNFENFMSLKPSSAFARGFKIEPMRFDAYGSLNRAIKHGSSFYYMAPMVREMTKKFNMLRKEVAPKHRELIDAIKSQYGRIIGRDLYDVEPSGRLYSGIITTMRKMTTRRFLTSAYKIPLEMMSQNLLIGQYVPISRLWQGNREFFGDRKFWMNFMSEMGSAIPRRMGGMTLDMKNAEMGQEIVKLLKDGPDPMTTGDALDWINKSKYAQYRDAIAGLFPVMGDELSVRPGFVALFKKHFKKMTGEEFSKERYNREPAYRKRIHGKAQAAVHAADDIIDQVVAPSDYAAHADMIQAKNKSAGADALRMFLYQFASFSRVQQSRFFFAARDIYTGNWAQVPEALETIGRLTAANMMYNVGIYAGGQAIKKGFLEAAQALDWLDEDDFDDPLVSFAERAGTGEFWVRQMLGGFFGTAVGGFAHPIRLMATEGIEQMNKVVTNAYREEDDQYQGWRDAVLFHRDMDVTDAEWWASTTLNANEHFVRRGINSVMDVQALIQGVDEKGWKDLQGEDYMRALRLTHTAFDLGLGDPIGAMNLRGLDEVIKKQHDWYEPYKMIQKEFKRKSGRRRELPEDFFD